MPRTAQPRLTRRSISLSREIDRKVQALARKEKRSANQILENLIETGLQAREMERDRFFELAERLQNASDKAEISRLKDELARMTFGS